jgi:hypothetical protein
VSKLADGPMRWRMPDWCPWPAVTYFLNYPNLWRF